MTTFLIILAIYLAIGLAIGIYIAISEKPKLFENIVLIIISTFIWGWFIVKLFYTAIKNGSKHAKREKYDSNTF